MFNFNKLKELVLENSNTLATTVQAKVATISETSEFQYTKGKAKEFLKMGCTLSGLSALYDSMGTHEDIYIGKRRFRLLQQIGEGGYAFVYLVTEIHSIDDEDFEPGIQSKLDSILTAKVI